MDVGLEIRQAREQRGLTLQQISKKTKIALHVLLAIEATDPTRLPAHVFTRSFVKTYAQEVGLDPDSTVRRFLEQVEPQDSPEPTHGQLEPPLTRPRDFWMPSTAQLLGGRFGTAAVLTVIGMTAMVLAVRGTRHTPPGETAQPAAPAVSAEVAAGGTSPAPAGTHSMPGTSGTAGTPGTGTPGTSGMSDAPGAPGASGAAGTLGRSDTTASGAALHLAIAPTGPCWVRATVGDEVVLAKLLQPGDRRAFDAPSDVTLRVGDPASCSFSIDGKPARVPGAAGQAVTVHVMKANYSQFLVRQ